MNTLEYVMETQSYDLGLVLKEQRQIGYILAKFEEQLNAFALLEPDIKVSLSPDRITLFCPERKELLNFLKAFGGKWDKTINEWKKSKIDYTQVIGIYTIRALAAQPPPACQLIEQEVLVPAVPEHMEKRMVISCPKGMTEEEVENAPAPTISNAEGEIL